MVNLKKIYFLRVEMEKSNSYFNCLVEISALSRNLVMHLKCNKLYTSDVFGNNLYIRLGS